ncbi:nucleolar protein 12 [Ceratitis capitata]|uniref:Nucleolar protein 12 n=1 Tax=Ceratitis capitata TaxID=7213 RepID=W8BJC7_CERCA|nr:nucleolar protein 12 [Ceratitis capitata]CAD7004485.1 unnamed protein product [Ceratitis capitata]
MRKKEIVFDSEKRKNFLTGFRKRKNERRARAKEELERNIKEERKRIRNDVKSSMAKLKKTFQPLVLDPEIEQNCLEKEYEDEEVQINVIELSRDNPKKEEDSDKDSTVNEPPAADSYINSIPGMDFSPEKESKEKQNKPKDVERTTPDLAKIGSKKMLDKLKKKKALKEIKKSKVFKQKERFDKKKQHKNKRDQKHSRSSASGAHGNKSKHNRFNRGHGPGRGRRK